MYRYYVTNIQTIDNMVLPDPEPDNWLGYRHKDKYYLKTKEALDKAEEIDREEVRTGPICTEKLKDQFP